MLCLRLFLMCRNLSTASLKRKPVAGCSAVVSCCNALTILSSFYLYSRMTINVSWRKLSCDVLVCSSAPLPCCFRWEAACARHGCAAPAREDGREAAVLVAVEMAREAAKVGLRAAPGERNCATQGVFRELALQARKTPAKMPVCSFCRATYLTHLEPQCRKPIHALPIIPSIHNF